MDAAAFANMYPQCAMYFLATHVGPQQDFRGSRIWVERTSVGLFPDPSAALYLDVV